MRWPAQGHRPVDEETGDQGGTTEGVFVSIDFARAFGCLLEATIEGDAAR